MADEAVVMSAPEKTRKSGTAARALRVKIGGVTVDAVGVRDAKYQAEQGDTVTIIPLSNGAVLILGPI